MDPQLQNRNKRIPQQLTLQFIYMTVELQANHME
jgi:hypothetical protein